MLSEARHKQIWKYQGVKEFHMLARIGCNFKERQIPKITNHL